MPHVREINEVRELETLRLTWQVLHGQTRDASFFQTLDWLLVYWKHYAGEQTLRVLVVSAGDETLGILPLVVRSEPTRVGSLRVLTYPLHNWGTFFGPIGPHPTATLMAGMEHVRRTPRDWDLVDLRWVNRDEVDHRRTPTALDLAELTSIEQHAEAVAMVEFDGTWDEYWMSRPGKWRSNLRRGEKSLAARGTVRFERYRPAGTLAGEDDPRWDLYHACEEVAGQSWQGAAADGTTMSNEAVRAFLREAHVAAAHAGMLDMCVLFVDEAPVAFAYNYQCEGRVFGLRTGYVAGFENAGTVLMQKMFADSFARRDVSLDLGAGYLDWKRPWLTKIVDSYHYTHYAPVAVRAQALRLKRWVSAQFQANQVAMEDKKGAV
ncbi:MAG: GNAT family N-acetyltransferase [Pirellulales bacterium]|nr:GNAT family N-acetyltransferase [Pirellulales bacterium]